MEEQMELPLPDVEDNTIYFETTTQTSDSVLVGNLGQFKEVFLIGVTDNGFQYRASNGDAMFWSFALERARNYLINSMG